MLTLAGVSALPRAGRRARGLRGPQPEAVLLGQRLPLRDQGRSRTSWTAPSRGRRARARSSGRSSTPRSKPPRRGGDARRDRARLHAGRDEIALVATFAAVIGSFLVSCPGGKRSRSGSAATSASVRASSGRPHLCRPRPGALGLAAVADLCPRGDRLGRSLPADALRPPAASRARRSADEVWRPRERVVPGGGRPERRHGHPQADAGREAQHPARADGGTPPRGRSLTCRRRPAATSPSRGSRARQRGGRPGHALRDRTRTELYELARQRNIRGRSKGRQSRGLIRALRAQ